MSNNIPDRNCQTLKVSIWALLPHINIFSAFGKDLTLGGGGGRDGGLFRLMMDLPPLTDL